jgi:DNA polymerase
MFQTLDEVRNAALDCVACGRSTTRQIVVFGNGNPHSTLMLIGEAPSSTDDSTGKPFTGPAGKLLDEVLADHGVHRRDIWITNLVRCFAGRERDGRIENQPAKAGEIRACRGWLDIELQFVDPRVILAVGAPAAKQLIRPDFRLQEEHGTLFERPDGRLAIATIQPAYVMRLRTLVDETAYESARSQLSSDIGKALQAAG